MRIVNLFSFLLTPHCVRFAVRMPPFWLRRRVCNWRRFSVFAFDYPLICNCFFGPIFEWSSIGGGVTERSYAATDHAALESGPGVRGYSFRDLGFRSHARSNGQIAHLLCRLVALRSRSLALFWTEDLPEWASKCPPSRAMLRNPIHRQSGVLALQTISRERTERSKSWIKVEEL